MGLTIHYSLHSDAKSPRKARQLIEALRQKALDLPFKEVGQVIDLSGDDCDFERRERDDPLRWLMIQAGQHIEKDGYGYCVLPKRVVAFSTWPGEGCEQANFGLALYPRPFRYKGAGCGRTDRLVLVVVLQDAVREQCRLRRCSALPPMPSFGRQDAGSRS